MRQALLGFALLLPLAVTPLAPARAAVVRSKPAAAAKPKAKPGKSSLRSGKSGARRGAVKRRGRKRREAPPQMPSRIELTAIDLVTGTAHLEVTGTTRPPVTQLFILTDQSGRRFVPHFAECAPPPGVELPALPTATAAGSAPGDEGGDEGGGEDEPALSPGAPSAPGSRDLPATTRWRCSLTIPRLYRRAPLASISMEWGQLRVAASDKTVQRLWGEARAAAPLSAIAERSEPRSGAATSPLPADPAAPPAPSLPPSGNDNDEDEPSEPGEELATHAARSVRSAE